MEVYIDDIVVKSKTEKQHLIDLRQALTRMRIHKLKMNPKKCAFGVRAGNFLGFLVHQRGKIQPLTSLLRLEDKENFKLGPPHQKAFDSIKAYLTSAPVLVPPQRGKPLKLYISASEKSIGSLLAQNNECRKEQVVYYLSRILTEVETRYSPVEKLCLALYFTTSKLRHCMLPCHVHIIAKTDVIKYMLLKPMLTGRIGKWILALLEFSFQYVPQRAVKGQAIADFLTEHQESQDEIINIQGTLEVTNYQGNTNNQAEYEALIIGLEILIELEAMEVEVFGDSELVINQLNGEYKCRHITIARGFNLAANEMAQIASGLLLQEKKYGVDVEIQRRNLPSILERGFSLDVQVFLARLEKDCKSYARGCEECQRHEPLQHVPSVSLNPVVKPWPFRRWAMDFIGHIYPASSKGYTFIIVATDYFTKCVEALAVKTITSVVVKKFIETKILHRFGVPETIVTDHGPSFISKEVEEFAKKYKIKIIQSSPYYPQSNGQAEAINKILINIIKRMVTDSPKKWHEKLGNTLWAYRTSKRAGTGTTPYALTFGQDAVLPIEINVSSIRIQNQFGLHSEEYIEAMCQRIEDLDVARIEALNQIQEGKRDVARAYNKKVKLKSFKEGDLVWKAVLPLGAQLRGFGKWSPRGNVLSLLVKY
ncbi:unnamed protein product [Malus baccata var. baccata]